MKKYVFLMMSLLLFSCSMEQRDAGLKNAKQFAREKVAEVAPTLVDEIESIELVYKDTVISSIPLLFESNYALKKYNEYYEGKCTKEEFNEVRDRASDYYWDIMGSMMYHSDKLYDEKYKDEWRIKYNLDVVMKSGVKKNLDVIMENDGITPSCLGSERVKELQKYYDNLPYIF